MKHTTTAKTRENISIIVNTYKKLQNSNKNFNNKKYTIMFFIIFEFELFSEVSALWLNFYAPFLIHHFLIMAEQMLRSRLFAKKQLLMISSMCMKVATIRQLHLSAIKIVQCNKHVFHEGNCELYKTITCVYIHISIYALNQVLTFSIGRWKN